MCDLCSQDDKEREAAKKNALFCAEQMETLANAYRQMAHGVLRPHSKEAERVGFVARSLVRELVAEWV